MESDGHGERTNKQSRSGFGTSNSATTRTNAIVNSQNNFIKSKTKLSPSKRTGEWNMRDFKALPIPSLFPEWREVSNDLGGILIVINSLFSIFHIFF
jgi:hypothetical protein